MQSYKHSQPGWVILVSMTAIIMFIMFSPVTAQSNPPAAKTLLLGVSAICLALFYKLTVSVDEEYLKLSFGFGIIKKKFLLMDIVSCEGAKTPWYSGFGIHGWGKQWLYNVSGFGAVKVTMKDGRVAWIGTDDKEELLRTLDSIVKH